MGRKLPTPVNTERLQHYLRCYDETESQYLFKGFTEGFRIASQASPHNLLVKNHPSTLQDPDKVSAKIAKEHAAGRIAGPFDRKPMDPMCISPLGLVPKKSPGEFRLIHDLSYPRGDSVNSAIAKSDSAVYFETMDHCVGLIRQLGRGCYISKADLADAYRILPIHPDDYKFLGFKWQEKYYYDKALVMGCSSSCNIFERFSNFIQWVMKHQLKVDAMSHILDDFIFMALSKDRCKLALDKFRLLCKDLNLPIKESKTVLPNTTVQLHGLEVDTLKLEIRLPLDKLNAARQALIEARYRKKLTLVELQSLIGTLNFACRAIEMGRPFLRRLIDLTIGVTHKHHRVRLTAEARKDIDAWLMFLQSFNGASIILNPEWTSSNTIKLYTDASSLGFAAVFGAKWCFGTWPECWQGYHITVKEMFPITLAIHMWGSLLCNHRILFLTDNEAVSAIVKKQSSKDPLIMKLVRQLVVASMSNNIMFSAKHIPGKTNVIADHLSRLSVEQARTRAPWLEKVPQKIPGPFLPWNKL